MAKIPTFDLTDNKSETHIIIFNGSPEQNHQNDVLIAIYCFKMYSIDPKNIHCFVPTLTKPFLTQAQGEVNVYSVDQYSSEVPLIQAKYIINFVTGHGSPSGICIKDMTESVVKPFDYFSPVHAITSLELGVFVIGPCYAGIFNYWDSNQNHKNYVFMGATGTHSSLNSILPGNFWGNVFLYYFSSWFNLSKTEQDVNGDNISDLLDCFKFASANTSKLILENRSKWYREIRNIEISLSNPLLTPFEKDNLLSAMNEKIGILHTVQEPWILNANQARKIIL